VDAAAEQELLGLVNSARANAGLPTVASSGHIQRVARAWAATMAANDTMAHNPNFYGQMQAGEACGSGAENVAFRYPPSAYGIHQQFMNSPSHATNVLNGNYGRVGIGAVIGPDGTMWVVQDFCGP
ncbi:MAG: CAP domain-containing protein, partial [Acidimicrobiales bacterium]